MARTAVTEQAGKRFIQIAERRRQTPHAEVRADVAQARERELDLDTTFRRHELVPLVDAGAGGLDRTRSETSALRESSSVRLSGVVTNAVGRRRSCRVRADEGVSPVRTSTVHCGLSARAARASASPVSAASARSGVNHSTVSGGGVSTVPAGPSASGPIHAA